MKQNKQKIHKEAQKILAEEQAAIFLMDPNTIIATEKGIEGFEFYPLPYFNLQNYTLKNKGKLCII